MKKLMFSLCALCLVGAASAQVSRAPLSEKAQKHLQSSVNSQMRMQDVQTTVSDRKVTADTFANPESWYGWKGKSFFSWMEAPGTNLKGRGYCNEDMISWVYGTGGAVSWSGTGEIGYRFATGPDTYYEENYIYPNSGIPYAAAAVVARAPSSGLLQNGEYPPMPFYFKLYDHTKVAPQQVVGGITKHTPSSIKFVDVVYPTDPERYSALTDTVWVLAGCSNDESGKPYFPADTLVRAEFKDVAYWKNLGNDFCLSMVFPIDWDEEGDSLLDGSRWNAHAFIMSEENGDDRISENLHSVYYVIDFEKQSVYNTTEDHKRIDGMLADEAMQPNTRYAIIPFDSWYWEDKTNTTGEPWMRIFYTESTALQSANKADRYVQLSPVPAVDYVNFKSYTDMSRIEIYSLGGQLVKAVNVSGDTYRLDLTGMNSGMYVARIYSEKGISSKKLIVR